MLHRFFVSELRHDDMLEHSLKAVGIPREVLHRMLPLPATFALCSSLSTYARQHTLSFKAALFLFENPGIEFNAAFKQHCETLGMPSGFYTPILHHATLNHEGAHEDITAELLEDVPCISVEDQQVVLRHTACLIEIMFHQEHQILDYYGQPNSVMPRCFD
jgi:hypothetical protein